MIDKPAISIKKDTTIYRRLGRGMMMINQQVYQIKQFESQQQLDKYVNKKGLKQI